MDTPICDFVRDYAARQPHRLHMPGHKGAGTLGVEHLDITEVAGADVLYHADGIIQRSQDNAAALFGTGATLYSTEGSSLCIRAMLRLARLHAAAQGRPATVVAGRNAHKVFMTAAALLDIDIAWLYPETGDSVLSCPLSPEKLDTFLSGADPKPAAVYVTSPDYLGHTAPIAALAEVCHRHDALLLVDNAHGAYLHFLPASRHPMALGADICCDSAHKTLGVLTGGAYLHLSQQAPAILREQAAASMALFASTSPSYLILQSLDATNRRLAEGYRSQLETFINRMATLKGCLSNAGYTLVGDEPLKLTIAAKAYGYTGIELAAKLEEQTIICEFCDPDYVVLMTTPDNREDTLAHLERVLLAIPQQAPLAAVPPPLPHPRRVLTPRQALLTGGRLCRVADSVGCVLADAAVSCPPAIPILVCGEVIDEAAVRLFEYYGTTHVRVIDPA